MGRLRFGDSLTFKRGGVVLVKFLGMVGLYFVVGRFGRSMDYVTEDARVLLPQSGVALGGLLLLGIGYWPAITLASLFVTLTSKVEPSLAVSFALSNTLGALVGAWMLRHLGKFDVSFSRIRDVYAFLVFGVILAPVVNATVAVAGFAFTQTVAWDVIGSLWWRRWFGHGISNLIVTPVLLTWTCRCAERWTWKRAAEALLLIGLVVMVCITVFTNKTDIGTLKFPISFAPFPFVIWAALRFELRGAVSITLLVSVIALNGTSGRFGPFALMPPRYSLVLLQIYLTAVALSAQSLAAAMAERRSAFEQLQASREQLRALSARVESAREEERTRIAREIHDELGQQLTGLKMGLHALARKLPPDSQPLVHRCEELSQLTDEAVQSVRRIASDLRPGILDDLGIVASMQWLVEQFQARTGIPARFESALEQEPTASGQSTALFRILQEALTNVMRHAAAQNVVVRLGQEAQWLVLEVEDDGVGIGEESLGDSHSLGILGMRERAVLLGGTLSVTSLGEQQPGTVVCARFPLDPSRASEMASCS